MIIFLNNKEKKLTSKLPAILTYQSVFSSLVLALLITSCNKFVEIPPPQDQVISSTVFTNDATAISTMNGLYSQMMSGNMILLNGAMSLYPGLTADEIYNTNSGSPAQSFARNSILASDPTNANFWARGYAYIYQVNAIIEGLVNSNKLTNSTKNQLLGESYFMRGLCYFYLTNLYGDVPLELSTDYQLNEKMPRFPHAKVYGQILSDLQMAMILLPVDYVTPDEGRPNKWTATALLARTYLFLQQWEKADSAATAVINSGAYALDGNLDSVFLKASPETIWQLIPVSPGFNTAEGNLFIPSSRSIIPQYAITSNLLQSFEQGDMRKEDWLDSNEINNTVYYFPYKYTIKFGTDVEECNVVLRLAEQYLIRAEAKAEEGNLKGAREDLNVIRNRAGLANSQANDQKSLLSAIQHEWRVEFFCEWGHRWFDLKRRGTINTVLGAEKPGWQTYDAVYPIPAQEINNNPQLVQNAGY